MVNAEKHRRKAIENKINKINDLENGNTIRNINKKENDLKRRIKPSLNSKMNLQKHFRKELIRESELEIKYPYLLK